MLIFMIDKLLKLFIHIHANLILNAQSVKKYQSLYLIVKIATFFSLFNNKINSFKIWNSMLYVHIHFVMIHLLTSLFTLTEMEVKTNWNVEEDISDCPNRMKIYFLETMVPECLVPLFEANKQGDSLNLSQHLKNHRPTSCPLYMT